MFERFDRDARAAVVLAQQEAGEMLAPEITPGHLLLGVVRSADRELSSLLAGYEVTADAVRQRLVVNEDAPLTDDDAAALRSIGIDLDEVRDRITRTFGADAFGRFGRSARGRRRMRGHTRFSRSAKKALELGLREALAHKDNRIQCEHFLLGILRGGDEVVTALITEHVDAQRLRGEVIALLDEAA